MKEVQHCQTGTGWPLAESFIKFPNWADPKAPKLGAAISLVASALDKAGFTLDMVSGDLLLGPSGNGQLPFRKKLPENHDPFSELPRIENGAINFVWDDLGSKGQSYEVIAYVT